MNNVSIARYGVVTQTLHWLTAGLVLIAFIFGQGGSEQHVYATARDFDRQLHETLGLTVFGLTIIRLLWRMVDGRHRPSAMAGWMGRAAKAVQGLLYALLFAVPLTAIAGALLEGHPLTLLAGINILLPVPESHSAGEIVAEIHTWLGDAILWLAGFHALAALYHHYFLKDDVLASMLPRRLPLGKRE